MENILEFLGAVDGEIDDSGLQSAFNEIAEDGQLSEEAFVDFAAEDINALCRQINGNSRGPRD